VTSGTAASATAAARPFDARKQAKMVDRVHRELIDADTTRIAGSYHAWQQQAGAAKLDAAIVMSLKDLGYA
jgi:hypothetical protein